MDSRKVSPGHVNPREGANIFSVIFMTFTFELFKKNHSRDLTVEDLWAPLRRHRSEYLRKHLESTWDEEMVKYKQYGKKPSLTRAIIKTFRKQFLYSALAAFFIESSTRLCQPILLGKMLQYFSKNTDVSQREAIVYATVFVLLTACYVGFVTHYTLLVYNLAMEIRVAISGLIYRKVMRLPTSTNKGSVGGEANNLIANDLKILPLMTWFIQYLWLSPVLLTALSYAVWVQIGWPGVAGVFSVLLLSGALLFTGKITYKYRKMRTQKSDERIQIIEEILLGVRFIKLYAWEKPFTSIVNIVRRAEMKVIAKSAIIRGIHLAFFLSSYRLACFCMMALMAFYSIPFTAEKVFPIAGYFTSVTYLASFLNRGILDCSEVLASGRRIEMFLLQEELTEVPDGPKRVLSYEDTPDLTITLENYTAYWDKRRTRHALSDINISVKKGSLVVIIGPVGSGKTTLLQAILGELQHQCGIVRVEGKMSYASQEPWVFCDTIRQNITFASEYDKERYEDVVKACALQPHFSLLSRGDLTVVGERGCSLSGGQKARISLARAVYNDADVYLLDDPLSAVDTHVAKHLFEACIMSFLKGKTRVLVTHQLQFLKYADHIVLLRDGILKSQGTFSHFEKSNFECVKYLEFQKNARSQSEKTKEYIENKMESNLFTDISGNAIQVCPEESFTGKLNNSVFSEYFLSGSNYLKLSITAFAFILTQATANTADYWMSYWTKQEEQKHRHGCEYSVYDAVQNFTLQELSIKCPEQELVSDQLSSTNVFCISVYTVIIVLLVGVSLLRAIMIIKICESCSNMLHRKVMDSIMRTRTEFFDNNPSGRVINRLSTDVGIMDELLPRTMLEAAQNLLVAAGTFVLASIFHYWISIIVVAIVFVIYIMTRIYLKTSVNLLRLEALSRSPIFVHLNATLQGLTTIRALKAQDILKKEFDYHQDLFTSATYCINASGQTFSFYVDFLCFIFISTVIYSFLLIEKSTYGGDVGLVVTQSYGIIMWLQFGVLKAVETATNMVSVERVAKYKYLEEEDNWDTSFDNSAPPGWPYCGCIDIKNMSLKYRDDMPAILKNISFVIYPGEKIGIVGRTGAGKSTLISALFRLAKLEGSILIDGIDTSTISLQCLRRSISIIPQDPFLYSGTIRENLDRFNEFRDEELWTALEYVEMKQVVHNSGGLAMKVADRGSNFSTGQKQLLCLARVILMNNKILVLDEATANVDLRTDEIIQKVLRDKFSNCTVLTVAHRLNTIMDSDKVMVMSNGKILEFDHPHLLLQNQEGAFYKMASSTGQLEFLSESASKIIMIAAGEKQQANPLKTASFVSKIFFWWTIPLFREGYKNGISRKNLCETLDGDKSAFLGNILEKNWKAELSSASDSKRKPSLLRSIAQSFYIQFAKLAALQVFCDLVLRTSHPLLVGKVLMFFEEERGAANRCEVYGYAFGIILWVAMISGIKNHLAMMTNTVGMQIRIACCSLIYRKVLRLSVGEAGPGHVVSLVSADVSRFQLACYYAHSLWLAPLSAAVVAGLVWREAGLPGLLGVVAVVGVVAPVQAYLCHLSAKYRQTASMKSDERIRIIAEIISAIKIIKMYAWENVYIKIVQAIRKSEISQLKKMSYLRGVYVALNLCSYRSALLVTTTISVVMFGETLYSAKVFVVSSFFFTLCVSILAPFVRALVELGDIVVSVRRIEDFLTREELSCEGNEMPTGDLPRNLAAVLANASAKWVRSSSEHSLRDVHMKASSGELVAVIGAVGSGKVKQFLMATSINGFQPDRPDIITSHLATRFDFMNSQTSDDNRKSSLLQALLGELPLQQGRRFLGGRASLVSQHAWLFPASVRRNVVFGSTFDGARYERVLRACALAADLRLLPAGDLTPVGDRGCSLSGGQRSRIALARAVYKEADVYLLDDPLSAVDAHVSQHIFEDCIKNFLKGKTRILVTHHLHCLKDVDKVVVMKQGAVEMEGTHEDLARDNVDYAALLGIDESTVPAADDEDEFTKVTQPPGLRRLRRLSRISAKSRLSIDPSRILREELTNSSEEFEATTAGGGSWRTFLEYFRAGENNFILVIMVLAFIFSQLVASSFDYWMYLWLSTEDSRRAARRLEIYEANTAQNSSTSTTISLASETNDLNETEYFLYVYVALIALLYVIIIARSLLYYSVCMNSSTKLHARMTNCVVNANPNFFDTNTSGRIINRFSKDVTAVDEVLSKSFLDASQILLSVLGTYILVIVVDPILILPVVIVVYFIICTRKFYIKTSVQLRRLECVCKSPMLTHLTATLQGLSVVRAYGAENVLQEEFDKHQDLHTAANRLFIAVSSAYGFALDIFGLVFLAVATSFFFIFEDSDAGRVGMSITQLMGLVPITMVGVCQACEVEATLTSVDRILEYTELEKEKSPSVSGDVDLERWPERGRIEFRNVYLKYNGSSPHYALKRFSVHILSNEKVGVVGRTGAGKSSLVAALLRMAPVEGAVLVDGVDTTRVPLPRLRTSISVIPQDPVLVSGTLRSNLDPAGELPDSRLWEALRQVDMTTVFPGCNGLEAEVIDGGRNFSVGQKQIICLARAILKKNKILVLDEATASVDPRTDELMQAIIRSHFAGCTVVTVAHRLQTVMDADKLLVLENGWKVEFNHPHLLLQNTGGVFFKMVEQTGPTMAEKLRRFAQQSYVDSTQQENL